MTELETLAARLDAALSTLEAGAGSHSGAESGGEEGAEVAALKAENTRLAQELARLKAARDKDIEELDMLIAQLKPLVGETA